MTIIEEFLEEYEAKECAEDMHYSVYFIPSYDQPEGE
jgi:hypothetical protein